MSQPLTENFLFLNKTETNFHPFTQDEIKLKENYLISNFDLQHEFDLYNELFFENILNKISVNFSEKMTKNVGLFSFYNGKPVIRLSLIILKYRSIKELRETLLHEMIHAYCYYKNYDMNDDLSGHGFYFKKKMIEINNFTGFKITIYHHFINEINLYSNIWRCKGKCRNKKPNFGFIFRQNNRKPQLADGSKFKEHKKFCGGEFEKLNITFEQMNDIIKKLNKKYENNSKSKNKQKIFCENNKENINFNNINQKQMKIDNFFNEKKIIQNNNNSDNKININNTQIITIKNNFIEQENEINNHNNKNKHKNKKINKKQLHLDNYFIHYNTQQIENNFKFNGKFFEFNKSQKSSNINYFKNKKKKKIKIDKNQLFIEKFLYDNNKNENKLNNNLLNKNENKNNNINNKIKNKKEIIKHRKSFI